MTATARGRRLPCPLYAPKCALWLCLDSAPVQGGALAHSRRSFRLLRSSVGTLPSWRQGGSNDHVLDETYHGDKLRRQLWRVDPTRLARPQGSSRLHRMICNRGTPLIDAALLQACIRRGVLRPDDVWIATAKAQRDLENLRWTFADLLDCLLCLRAEDYKGAEWCRDQQGNWHPCDAYAIRYDDVRRCRLSHSDINYYLKFSIGQDGTLQLIFLSCHL